MHRKRKFGRRIIPQFAILFLTLYIPLVASAEDIIPGWPIAITEFMFIQSSGLPEWVEIYNQSDSPVDLTGWQLGDELALRTIPPCTLHPGQFAVLCQNPDIFADTLCEGAFIIRPSGWPILNNDRDLVRLHDPEGRERHLITYVKADFGDCMTYDISAEVTTIGGTEIVCCPAGSTPGCPNAIWGKPEGEDSIEISPNPFDPSREVAHIRVALPGSGLLVRIYDRSGVSHRILARPEDPVGFNIEWDGTDDRGKRLPAGVYIVFASDSEGNSVKRAIAIIGAGK